MRNLQNSVGILLFPMLLFFYNMWRIIRFYLHYRHRHLYRSVMKCLCWIFNVKFYNWQWNILNLTDNSLHYIITPITPFPIMPYFHSLHPKNADSEIAFTRAIFNTMFYVIYLIRHTMLFSYYVRFLKYHQIPRYCGDAWTVKTCVTVWSVKRTYTEL